MLLLHVRSTVKPVLAELSAMLRRPLQALRRNDECRRHRRCAAQARHQLARTVSCQQRRPAKLQHVPDDARASGPNRNALVQRFEHLVRHHAAHLNDSDVPLDRRHRAGRLKRPPFLSHHRRRSIVTGPHRSERGALLPCDSCCVSTGSSHEPAHFCTGSLREFSPQSDVGRSR